MLDNKIPLWLALQHAPGLGPAILKRLYNEYSIAETIIQNLYNNKYLIKSQDPSELMEYLDKINIEQYSPLIEKTIIMGAKICTLEDPEYPENLKRSTTAPAVLFYKGSLDKLSPRSLAVVGRVDPSSQGVYNATKFVSLCAINDIQVISGLARGIDTASHKAALRYSGLTYAVIAHGIDRCYPPENKELFEQITENGAVITQFPTGTRPNRWMFPARNETMCTISSGTVIIEACENCGSLIQAQHSFRHGRRVFILSPNIQNNTMWAHKLINKGALVIDKFETVIKEMADIQLEFKNERGQMSMEQLFSAESSKAILFDLDGVLLNTLPILMTSYIKTFNTLEKSSIDEKLLLAKINNAPTYIFKIFGVDSKIGNDLFKKYYAETINNTTPFFPEVEKALLALKNKGTKLGIVTSQPLNRYKMVMEKAPFKDLIDTSVTWNDLTRNQQKPHPAGIIKALQALSVKPQNAAYVGDDLKDILAAKNAGVKAIAVTWGLGDQAQLLTGNPDMILTDPLQLSTIEPC